MNRTERAMSAPGHIHLRSLQRIDFVPGGRAIFALIERSAA